MSQDARVKQYARTKVQTANRGKLLLMVYDVALNSLKASQKCILDGDLPSKGQNMDRAIRAVGELRTSLDMEKGQEIAGSLDRLYDFMLRRMSEANMADDAAGLDVVVRILEDLKTTWEQVLRKSVESDDEDSNCEISA
jgi:flagellar secretion chaperone FliS